MEKSLSEMNSKELMNYANTLADQEANMDKKLHSITEKQLIRMKDRGILVGARNVHKVLKIDGDQVSLGRVGEDHNQTSYSVAKLPLAYVLENFERLPEETKTYHFQLNITGYAELVIHAINKADAVAQIQELEKNKAIRFTGLGISLDDEKKLLNMGEAELTELGILEIR